MDTVLDARGLACPLPAIKARRALPRVPPGAALVVLATDPEAPIDVAAVAADAGWELETERHEGGWRMTLRRPATLTSTQRARRVHVTFTASRESHPRATFHRGAPRPLPPLLVPLAACAALAVAPAAGHAAVPVGSDLTNTVLIDEGCDDRSASCTRMLLSVGGVEASSPIDGVVVRWRLVGEGTVRLRVIHRDGDTWSSGASAPATLPSGGSSRGTFATRLPIRAGDFLGVDGDRENHVHMGYGLDAVQARAHYFYPALQDGESLRVPITQRATRPVRAARRRGHRAGRRPRRLRRRDAGLRAGRPGRPDRLRRDAGAARTVDRHAGPGDADHAHHAHHADHAHHAGDGDPGARADRHAVDAAGAEARRRPPLRRAPPARPHGGQGEDGAPALGLPRRHRARVKGRGVKRGRVLAQSRPAGRTLAAGARVNLRVRG